MSTTASTLAHPVVQAVRPVEITDGTIEALKWLGLALMTLDHVNKYLWHDSQAWAFAAGRLTMPLFGFVLAYNLARPGSLASGLHSRVAVRIAAWGLVASAPFLALGGLVQGWWPLNIMFMLLAATVLVYLAERGGLARIAMAVAVFLVAGAFVEFFWYGLAFVVLSWAYCRTRAAWSLVGMVLAAFSLVMVNGNLWAMLVLPLLLAAPRLGLLVPRVRHLFYVYYPLHLAVLLAIRSL